jgi:hypothetical protein
MPRDGAIIFGHASKKLNAPYRSGPSKAWLKIKNPKAAAATREQAMADFKARWLATPRPSFR